MPVAKLSSQKVEAVRLPPGSVGKKASMRSAVWLPALYPLWVLLWEEPEVFFSLPLAMLALCV